MFLTRSLIAFAFTAILGILPSQAKEPFIPNMGPDLSSITVQCGDLTLKLRQSSQWTPARFDYLGKAMTTEHSAYGTVFLFPNLGWIGTNHLDTEPEELTSLEFFLDGKKIESPSKELKGDSFRFVRESKIRDFTLHCEIELSNNRILETTRVQTEKAVPLSLVYHFMHAWVPTVDAFLAGTDDEPDKVESGVLTDDEATVRSSVIQRPVDWMAVRDPVSQQFAVSRLLKAPEGAATFSKIWNVPGTYRKYYLVNFSKAEVPAYFDGTWQMVTSFGSVAENGDWEPAAKTLSQSLKSK